MKLVERNCPHCGARLEIDEDKKKAFCMYCGAELTIDSEKPATPYNNAEAAGYEFEKGRQRAREEMRGAQRAEAQWDAGQQAASANPYAGQSATYGKPKKHLFWWVVGWIFIFPIPLTIVTVRSKLPKWAKALIIVAAWAVYLGFSLANNNNDEGTAILRRLTPLR